MATNGKGKLHPQDKLIILEDTDNGYEFYVQKLDLFQVAGQEYIVLAPYEPDDGEHNAPDVVIMRVLRAENSQPANNKRDAAIQFESIKDQLELDAVFARFNERMVAEIIGA